MEKHAGITPLETAARRHAAGSRPLGKWFAIAAVIVVILVGVTAALAPGLSSIARSKTQVMLQNRFESDLQIQSLKVSLFPSVVVSGESVALRRKGHADEPPLIQVAKFRANGSLLGLLTRHLRLARLEG
jgi:uncharacterized protein involved in outer membrane biogenesis